MSGNPKATLRQHLERICDFANMIFLDFSLTLLFNDKGIWH